VEGFCFNTLLTLIAYNEICINYNIQITYLDGNFRILRANRLENDSDSFIFVFEKV
jgi:hypothetical protein